MTGLFIDCLSFYTSLKEKNKRLDYGTLLAELNEDDHVVVANVYIITIAKANAFEQALGLMGYTVITHVSPFPYNNKHHWDETIVNTINKFRKLDNLILATDRQELIDKVDNVDVLNSGIILQEGYTIDIT